MEFQALPEGCIASILSGTTPEDVCRLSLVSKTFCSAAESDQVWDRFLPSDYHSIISEASPPLPDFPSKKALYLALSDRPLILRQGKMSFQLEKKSGKKCFMLAARALTIVWGDSPQYWNWNNLPDSSKIKLIQLSWMKLRHFYGVRSTLKYVRGCNISLAWKWQGQGRFPEVAELLDVCWLEIRGVLNTLALSPRMQYAAYLVFKMLSVHEFGSYPVELSVGIAGGNSSTKNVCLDYLDPEDWEDWENLSEDEVVGLPGPNTRSDGWLEIEMGEFFSTGLEDEVQMSVLEIISGQWKSGFIVEGIEVRPKEHN